MDSAEQDLEKMTEDILYFLNLEVFSISKSRGKGGICVYIKVEGEDESQIKTYFLPSGLQPSE